MMINTKCILQVLCQELLKTKQQAPNGVTYAESHVIKLRLSWLSQKWTLMPVYQESSDQHWLDIRLMDPCSPLTEHGLVTARLSGLG